jgi:hypothetical protein
MVQRLSIPGGFTGIFMGAIAGVALVLLLSPAIHGLSIAGVSIGAFMGALAGVALLLLVSPAIRHAPKPLSAPKPVGAISKLIVQLIAAILLLPVIVFGGNWMSTHVLLVKEDENFSDCYTLSLTLVFLMIIAYPVSRWILNCGRSLGGLPAQAAPPKSAAPSGRPTP